MSTLRMLPRRMASFLPAVLLLLPVGAAVAETGKAEASNREELVPALCRTFESGTKGYSLRCPKRVDPFRGENTRIKAVYKIGQGETRQAEVFGDASSWLVHIADHALPGDTVQLWLTYYYAPSEAVKQDLEAELKKFDQTVVDSITLALRTHGTAWMEHVSINPDAPQYALLNSARSRDDTSTLPVLLKGLGFKQDASTQRWGPTTETLELLNATARKDVESGVLAPKLIAVARTGAKACLEVLNEGALGETPQVLIGMASRCLERARQAAAPPKTPPPADAGTEIEAAPATGAAPAKDSCPALFSTPIAQVKPLEVAASGDAFVKATDALVKAQEDGNKADCAETTMSALASANSLLSLARHLWAAAQAETALRARVDEVAAVLVVVTELADVRKDLLEAEAERRGYSLSSGAVYLTGMDDLVYPVAVSVCPVFGCLRGDEQFWSSGRSVVRSFSAEIGIAAVTADTHDDARRRDGPGFLLGVSWQGLAPFKLSGGTFFFENQETRGWQFDGFVGVTLDAAKAVEMMGLFGVTVPVQLKSTDSNPASR